MAALSPQAEERARKNNSAVLQALSAAGQSNVAKALEISEPTVSRMKEKEIPDAAKLLALLQLKVVPEQYRCVDPAYLAGLEHFSKCWLEYVTAQGKATEGKALTWD
jgi:hypothetical protein